MERIYRTYVRTLTAITQRAEQRSAPDAGLTTVEWGLLTGGVALVAIAAVAIFSAKVTGLMDSIPGG